MDNLNLTADNLKSVPNLQVRWILFIQSFQTKINHILRQIPPSLTDKFSKQFESLKENIFNRFIEEDTFDNDLKIRINQQIKLKISEGGFGLIDTNLLRFISYSASVFDCHNTDLKMKYNFINDQKKLKWMIK
jgi:hypothetical protein